MWGRVLVLAVAAMMAIAACGSEGDAGGEGSTITVFAAASLTDAMTAVADAYEAEEGADVRLNFAASSALREQILAGAPADVFASANESNMEALVEAGAATDPAVFVTNSLQIVVPAGNPASISGLEDFDREDLLLGLCAVEVPCGEFGRDALARAGVTPAPDTNEPDVRSLLTKVAAGELDAGIVYVTDVLSAGDEVEGIAVAADDNVVATYPIAPLTESGDLDAARSFVDFVLGPEGRAILASFGFELP